MAGAAQDKMDGRKAHARAFHQRKNGFDSYLDEAKLLDVGDTPREFFAFSEVENILSFSHI